MDHRTRLVDVIRSVRNRWRLKLAMRGAVVVVAGTVLALLLSASGLESFRFSAAAIIAFRIISITIFVGLLAYGLVWPLRRRVTDSQVAMYLEESDPTLESAIISAVEATANGGSPDHSPQLVDRLVEQAVDRCIAVGRGHTAANGTFEGMLLRLEKPVDYYVESNGVRSPMFTLSVVDLPTVAQLDLEYHFPAYTGLAPRKVEGGGDVAAIRGTDVQLRITPTMAAPGGRILLNDGAAAPLAVQGDGTLTGVFKIERQGFYRIELTGPHGEKVEASPQYTIDVIDDQAPAVRFTKPGRDTQASPVEELFLEATADDDYGVKSLQMFYSVNGSAPKTVNLFAGGKPLPEVSAGHTIYLEELGLKPGDFVSYYAKATDTDVVQGPKTTTSDIYFVQIRPFRKDYKPAQSMGGGGGGGGGQQVGELSRQQREIVAATFNIVRDKAKTKHEKYRENVVFLNLAQAKLREQDEEQMGKLKARLSVVDPAFNKIAEVLPKAAEEMRSAEGDLKAVKPDSALSPEQRALKLLQEAEQQYEMQVAMQNGGGGGGGQSQLAEDLADLFELELDKLANQYEIQQRAMQQSSDHQVDELVEKL